MFSEFDEDKSIFAEEQEKIKERLAYGNCETFEEYRFVTGIHEGLTQAVKLLDNYMSNVLSEMNEDDDDF